MAIMTSRSYSITTQRLQLVAAFLVALSVYSGEALHHPLHCQKWQHHCQKYDRHCTGEVQAEHKVWRSCCDPLKYEASGDSSLQNFNDSKGLSSDIYTLKMSSYSTTSAWCDMTTDGGGWMTILRRSDTKESFDRFYDEYEDGFGDLAHDFFFGLRLLHDITSRDYWEMRIDFYNRSNDTESSSHGLYESFKIGRREEECDLDGRCEGYRLHLGTLVQEADDPLYDGLKDFNSQYFVAKRRDDTSITLHSCLGNGDERGGWWYVDNSCTGESGTGSVLTDHYNLLSWYDPNIPHTTTRRYDKIELKIRQKGCLSSESNLTS